jgi:hypothetical protein
VEKKEPDKSNLLHYMHSQKTDGAFMLKDDMYGREKKHQQLHELWQEILQSEEEEHCPCVRMGSTTIDPKFPAHLHHPRITKKQEKLKLAQ